jgi:hypothetical protein
MPVFVGSRPRGIQSRYGQSRRDPAKALRANWGVYPIEHSQRDELLWRDEGDRSLSTSCRFAGRYCAPAVPTSLFLLHGTEYSGAAVAPGFFVSPKTTKPFARRPRGYRCGSQPADTVPGMDGTARRRHGGEWTVETTSDRHAGPRNQPETTLRADAPLRQAAQRVSERAPRWARAAETPGARGFSS